MRFRLRRVGVWWSLGLLLLGCQTHRPNLVGRYELVSATNGGGNVVFADGQWAVRLAFGEDGTYQLQQVETLTGKTTSGRYTLQKDRMTLTNFPIPDAVGVCSYALDAKAEALTLELISVRLPGSDTMAPPEQALKTGRFRWELRRRRG